MYRVIFPSGWKCPLYRARFPRAQESLPRRSSLVICLLFSMLVSCISGFLFFWLKYMFVQKNRKINIKKRSAHKMQVLNPPPFPQVTTDDRLMSISPVLSMCTRTHRPFVTWTGLTLFIATTCVFSPRPCGGSGSQHTHVSLTSARQASTSSSHTCWCLVGPSLLALDPVLH